MLRIAIDLFSASLLHNFALRHDEYLVADMLDHCKVMGDEEIGQAELVLQVLQKIDNLRLHRDVERADRLVADDKVWLDREGAGDADALALASAELVRVALHEFGREAYMFE